VLLNDDIADGTDISWVWDTDWESLAPHVASVVVGGRRAADMALRLAYAGFPEPRLAAKDEHDIEAALRDAIQALPPGEGLVILPTYTALLEVRGQLAQWVGLRRIGDGA
jgi:UDP-N-acetylmuramyl tripeptide synthase